jgi:hypothetical protein
VFSLFSRFPVFANFVASSPFEAFLAILLHSERRTTSIYVHSGCIKPTPRLGSSECASWGPGASLTGFSAFFASFLKLPFFSSKYMNILPWTNNLTNFAQQSSLRDLARAEEKTSKAQDPMKPENNWFAKTSR